MGGTVDYETLHAQAAGFVKEHRLPGAAVGVVVDGELTWSVGVGFADLASGRRPDATTLFRIASITKTFTGTAVMQLCAAGRLGLDDPAVEYLPELSRAQGKLGPISAVTIRRLLSHESGLAGDPPGTDFGALVYEGRAERTLARADEIATVVPPHSQAKYSNLGYQLLGEIVARVSGAPFPRYVEENVLAPLGMSATAFEPLPGPLQDLRAVGYNPRGFSDYLEPAPPGPQIWAEGGLWSSVADMARWVGFQLGAYGPANRDDTVLDASARRAMHTPRYLGDPDDWSHAMGISWHTIRRDEVTLGTALGWVPRVYFQRLLRPEDRCRCRRPRQRLWRHTGASPWGWRRPRERQHFAARRALSRRRRCLRPGCPCSACTLDDYSTARLEWRDGELTFVDPDNPGWRPRLVPTDDPDVFVVGPGCGQSGNKRGSGDSQTAGSLLSYWHRVRSAVWRR